MTDLNKLLREKLLAKDDLMDAHQYTVSVGAGGYGWAGSGNNINPTWTALDEVRDNIKQLDYILQRIVPNYDELVAQYRAIKDIEEAGE